MGKRKAPKGTYWRGGTLWARVQINGRDERWSLRTDDPETAKRRLKAERERQIAAVHFGDHRRTFAEALDGWASKIARDVSHKTVVRYTSSLAVLKPFLDGMYLDEINKALIDTIVETRRTVPMVPTGKKRAIMVTDATIKRDLTALASVLDYAIDKEWMEHNVVRDWLRPARRKKSRIRERRDPIILPDPEHVQMVIDRAPGLFAAMIRAGRRTGARLEELTLAKRSQLDHAAKQLTVIGKRNKRRVIDLEGWGYDDVFRSLPAAIGSQWLFWHHSGDRYSTASTRFRTIVASVAKQAQKQAQSFRPFRFHDLRHLHAVEWLKAGRSIYDLQKRLGHTSIQTTEMYLEFLTPEEVRIVKLEGTKDGTSAAVLKSENAAK